MSSPYCPRDFSYRNDVSPTGVLNLLGRDGKKNRFLTQRAFPHVSNLRFAIAEFPAALGTARVKEDLRFILSSSAPERPADVDHKKEGQQTGQHDGNEWPHGADRVWASRLARYFSEPISNVQFVQRPLFPSGRPQNSQWLSSLIASVFLLELLANSIRTSQPIRTVPIAPMPIIMKGEDFMTFTLGKRTIGAADKRKPSTGRIASLSITG